MQIKEYKMYLEDYEKEFLVSALIELLEIATNEEARAKINSTILKIIDGKVAHYEKHLNELQIFFYDGKVSVIES